MFDFPKNLYTDVRIEDVYETNIKYNMMYLSDIKERNYKAAFIRIFDGERWYYSSTDNTNNIQFEIDKLTSFANCNASVYMHPIVLKLQKNIDSYIRFSKYDVSKIPIKRKIELLQQYFSVLKEKNNITYWNATYMDKKVNKLFYSSKGSQLNFDTQKAGFLFGLNFSYKDNKFFEVFQRSGVNLNDLIGHQEEFKLLVSKCERFVAEATPFTGGCYPVFFSPNTVGIFIHECFGHLSEADFLIDIRNAENSLKIGEVIAPEFLSVVDDGRVLGNGYVPYDDEGTRAVKTYLIKNGKLNGRLHNSITAAAFNESLTGNARALNYSFEPIVRMTTTYIEAGNKSYEEILGEVSDGLFIETARIGSGGTDFSIVPGRSYLIKNGKVAEPVYISNIRGNVFNALKNIRGISKESVINFDVFNNCGKIDQGPLPVSSGGPYICVDNLEVY